MAVNSGKAVVGGLVAGVVANLLDYLFQGILLKPDFEMMRQRLNLDPAAASNPVPWIVVDFVLGFLLIVTVRRFPDALGSRTQDGHLRVHRGLRLDRVGDGRSRIDRCLHDRHVSEKLGPVAHHDHVRGAGRGVRVQGSVDGRRTLRKRRKTPGR